MGLDDRCRVEFEPELPAIGPELVAVARILEVLRQFDRVDVRRRILAYVVDETEHA